MIHYEFKASKMLLIANNSHIKTINSSLHFCANVNFLVVICSLLLIQIETMSCKKKKSVAIVARFKVYTIL
jgi:hypothetical protein